MNGEPATDGGRRNSRIGLAVGAVVVILLLLLVIGNGTSNGPPFSPRSTTESGTRALVRLLEAEGADVELRAGPPLASDDIALVLVDRFASRDPNLADSIRDDIDRIDDWVDSGGTLVIADPASSLMPSGVAGPYRGGSECEIAALASIVQIELGEFEGFDLSATGNRRTCFASGSGAGVVVADRGDGAIVGFGLRDTWRNDRIGDGDHASLAVALLAPRAGRTIVILEGPEFGTGDGSLLDLTPAGVKWGLGLAAFAFLVYALGKARRHGSTVREPQLVEIAGSELVIAVGAMLERSRQPAIAAASLRDEARREFAKVLTLPRSTPAGQVLAALANRPAATMADLEYVLGSEPVANEDDLVKLASTIDKVRSVILPIQPSVPEGVSK